ncbi:MAG: type II toxin-antitoxin system death-on-curing family toxin [Leptospiraceae bacterium]|mgnify:CR=1 FL=1|nr:type II toxin-antitoxin system death-on-curing family toxin [Leptospiraceae bacterium]
MSQIIYINIEQVVSIHKNTVYLSGGGSIDHFDLGRLESVLDHIQNDDYYPTFEDKLTHLFFSTNQFHCFHDGNKRLSIALSAFMLILNGYLYCSSKFIKELENISYHVAAGKINKDLLKEIIESILFEDYDNDEQLKLKILQAIQDNDEL